MNSLTQLHGPFELNTNVLKNFLPENYYIKRIGVRGDIGATFFLYDNMDNQYKSFIIGNSRFVQLFNTKISELYFTSTSDSGFLVDLVIGE